MVDLILKYRLSSSYILLFLLTIGCSPEQILPAKTHEGRNVIGYRSEDGMVYGSELDSLVLLPDGEILMRYFTSFIGYNHSRDYMLRMVLAMDTVVSTYYLKDASYQEYSSLIELDVNETNIFNINYYNEDMGILAGEFELNFAELDSVFPDIGAPYIHSSYRRKITDGRFDIQLPH